LTLAALQVALSQPHRAWRLTLDQEDVMGLAPVIEAHPGRGIGHIPHNQAHGLWALGQRAADVGGTWRFPFLADQVMGLEALHARASAAGFDNVLGWSGAALTSRTGAAL
jgi:hypothetical protein